MSTSTVPMDDAALFSGATSEETPAEVTFTDTPGIAATTPEPEAGQPRDEQGRFAPKAPDAPAEAQPQTPPEPAAATPPPAKDETIPSWRLKEEADNRRQAEQRAAHFERQLLEMQAHLRANQPQEKRPDFFENPDAATEHHVRNFLEPHLRAVQQQMMHLGQMAAVQAYGVDVVRAADDAFTKAVETRTLEPADWQRVMNAPNKYEAAVQWHKRQTALATVGDDPAAWFDKQLGERLKDQAFQTKLIEQLRGNVQQSSNGQRPVVQIPPSLSRATSAAPNTPDDTGDLSDASLFRHATR